jgi:hypothetical protein
MGEEQPSDPEDQDQDSAEGRNIADVEEQKNKSPSSPIPTTIRIPMTTIHYRQRGDRGGKADDELRLLAEVDDQHHEEACYAAECHYRQRGEESGGSPTRGIGSAENPGHSEQPGGHCDRDEEATRPTVALERDDVVRARAIPPPTSRGPPDDEQGTPR